jgi:hypothetical protein
MKDRLVNLALAAVATAILCWFLLRMLLWLIVPCILTGSPRPPDYPFYCDGVGQIPTRTLSWWLIVPLLIFFGCLWAVKKVRER